MSERQKNLVVLSINLEGDSVCADIFQRDDGTFGFEEYRRDHEDGRGWFPIGFHSGKVFGNLESAKQAAGEAIGWLEIAR